MANKAAKKTYWKYTSQEQDFFISESIHNGEIEIISARISSVSSVTFYLTKHKHILNNNKYTECPN